MKSAFCAPVAGLCAIICAATASANTNHGPSSFHAAVPSWESCLHYGYRSLEYRPWECGASDDSTIAVNGTIIHGGTGAQTVYTYYDGGSSGNIDCYLFSYDSSGNQLAMILKSATCNSSGTLTWNLTSAQRSYWGSETMQCFIPKYCYLRGYSTT